MSYQTKMILQQLKSSTTSMECGCSGRENCRAIVQKLKSHVEFLENHLNKNHRSEKQVFTVADCFLEAIGFLGTDSSELTQAAERLIAQDYLHIGKMFSEANKFIEHHKKFRNVNTIDLESGNRVGEYRLQRVEVKSKSVLRKWGKKFNNCLARPTQVNFYFPRVQLGKLQVWLLLRDDKPFGLLSLITRSREVYDFDLIDDENDCGWSYSLAMEILDKLDAEANCAREFVKVGAYDKFKQEQPIVEPDVIGENLIWIWRFKNEIIIAQKDRDHIGDDLSWSRFSRTPEHSRTEFDGEWEDCMDSHLKFGDLLNLLMQHPELIKRLNGPVLEDNR